MNLLNKLTIKNLKLNKKRTVVTVIGIMLSVALITAVATMYSSLIKSLINYEVYEKGYFHVSYYDVPINEVSKIKNTREVLDVYLTKNIGYSKLEEFKNKYKPYVFVKGFTKSSLNQLSVKLIEGRLPENEDEILIPTHLKTNGRVVMNIGDTITLNIGKRVADGYELTQSNPYQEGNEDIIDTNSKTYKIVGIIERPASNIENYEAPGYTFITYLDEKDVIGNVDVYAKYTKKGSKDYLNVTASILGVDKKMFKEMYTAEPNELTTEEFDKISTELDKAKYNYEFNTYLMQLENDPLSDDTVGGLRSVVVIVIIIIIVTSVFCIKNSFDISITEKIKQYGMLRSIGATKKQIKNNVFYEATILGIIGIPLGLMLGMLASYILIIVSNILLNGVFITGLKLVLSYSFTAFLIALVLGFVTIYASALKSAKKASKVSPIDSIRNSSELKIKSKKINCPKIINKIFGIGGEISYKNLKRNKKKYRTTIISIIVSVSVFIALSFFISSSFGVVKETLSISDYNVSLHKYISSSNTFEELAKSTVTLDTIEDYAIYRKLKVKIKDPKYNDEYIKLNNHENECLSEDGCILLLAVEDYQYKKYLKSLDLDYNEYKNKGILFDTVKLKLNGEGKQESKTLREFTYKHNEKIDIDAENSNINIEVGYISKTLPFSLQFNNAVLIVSDEVFDKMNLEYDFDIFYKSNNANKLQDEIDEILDGEEYTLDNIEENAKIMRNLYTLIAIFLYGFIIVISLIGITNIFNTITTNMQLRKQEFAMLKSVGMTKKEFNNMIRLESIFMGLKALIIGIPIGIILSYLIYKALMLESGFAFKPPLLAILISIIVVYLLITILMKYSMKKISKQNIVETIRNENI